MHSLFETLVCFEETAVTCASSEESSVFDVFLGGDNRLDIKTTQIKTKSTKSQRLYGHLWRHYTCWGLRFR